ncbi:MAG TPA: PAS domain S-box protein, partial [Anaerolineae bacterium]|nr:PAS domain S-box protein [Anaerolineae bacterium]
AGAGAVWETAEFRPPRVKVGRQGPVPREPEGITGWVATSGEPLLVPDLSQESRYYSLPEAGEMQSELAVPLKTKERVIGVLHVQSQRLNAFDGSDLDVLQALAHQAAIAIENARLFTEVRRQQQFSESLVQNIPVAIVAVAADNKVTSWNPAAERLFGYTQDEVLGRGLVDLITTPEMRDKALQFVDHAMASARVHAVTQRCRQDGSLVDVELLAVPVSTGDGEMGLVAIYHDITDLKRATRAIEESQRLLAGIIDFLPDATVVIDREGKVIAWNRAMEEMTGVRAQDILHKGDYEYALPFYGTRRPILIDLVLLPDEELETRYANIERHGATLLGEALVPVLRGKPAFLFATASALRDSRGQIAGAIETIRDISDRKQVEEELRQAKAAAEAATQAKSAFLATMSHEIRTPMNAVIGMTSLLLDTPLSPEQREFAETIRSSGDALLTVINDILDFSKIEAGRIELERQPFDVRECVESAVGLVAGQAAARGLELGCWIDPQVPAGIVGDEARLRQIVLNLLSNALKFTEQGEVVVNMTVEEDVKTPLVGSPSLPVPASFILHFTVRDTGLGIPPDRMDRLFQSFSQVDSSTTRKYGGTGLGLAISQRLAELMGGRIWAESTGIPGQGSTFHFTMRAHAATIPARAELQAAAPDLRGRRVLIVDDNATSRRIRTLQVEAWGMAPQATGSPSEALGWLRSGRPFDLAILDRQMPEMDGVMLAGEMRRMRDERALPLIMVSSLGK